MVTNIGLMDYDCLRQRIYRSPNYDLSVIYAYLRPNKNLNVRLIMSPNYENLKQYDKIYVFKQDRLLAHPSSYITNYYNLPIEEYGPGFLNKPLRPFQLETREIAPDCSCYNSIILFSAEKPKHVLAWKLDKKAKGKKYQPIRLYEQIDGDDLKKDYPTQKFIMCYDDPVDILNNPQKLQYFLSLIALKRHFLFTKPLDISLIHDTNILEQVLSDRMFAGMRKEVMASILNENVAFIVNQTLEGKNKKKIRILVKPSLELGPEICFEQLLIMIYYKHKSNNKVCFKVGWGKQALSSHTLASLAYKYIAGKGMYMSFYEYVFNIAYLRMGVPFIDLHTGEDRHRIVIEKYGVAPLMLQLETWLISHPHLTECIFIGGDSDYAELRRQYHNIKKRKYAFQIEGG